jgi:hypothetical protein
MNRDGQYGVYKVLDSDGAICFVSTAKDTSIEQVEADHRSSLATDTFTTQLNNKGAAWQFSWMIGPKLTSNDQIQKIARGIISRNNPQYN